MNKTISGYRRGIKLIFPRFTIQKFFLQEKKVSPVAPPPPPEFLKPTPQTINIDEIPDSLLCILFKIFRDSI